jgi:K+-sensing histidine kinase KdpD
MVDNKSNAGPLILLGLIALGVGGVVVYFLAEPRIDRGTVNNVAYICAAGPLVIALVISFFVGQAWLEARRHNRRREDEAMRGDVLYRRQQDAHAQSTDLAVLRQMTQVVEAGARAQLTAAKAQHEMARSAALQPPAEEPAAYWTIPAEWAETD